MDKTDGYDIRKLISGVANDWVTCRCSKSFLGYECLMFSLSIINLLVSDALCDLLDRKLKVGKHRGFIYLDKSVFVDTRSVSAMGSLTTENIDACNLMMFAECTAELRLGSGRAIEIIA